MHTRMIINSFSTLVLLAFMRHAEGQEFETLNGRVRGETVNVNGRLIDALLSIPFAKPPVGNLRFKPPQPADPWQGVLEATKPSSACIQSESILEGTGPDDPRYFTGNNNEDCLYLNIWRPSNATRDSNLPVMLWIYGGGFSFGTKDTPLNNGQYLTSYDVIVVSMNYRIGILGFGYLGQDTLPGNLGLLDQLEAMKWVRNNIGNFGGDPDKVTLFGESAGSWSVGLHQFSPLSKDYYQNAIMQSGSPISSVLDLVVYSHQVSRENVRKFAEALKCPGYSDRDTYNCLMAATAEQIRTVSSAMMMEQVDFFPVVDGDFLLQHPKDLLSRGLYKKNNVLTGVTKDESTLFFPLMFNVYTNTTYDTGEKLTSQFLDRVLPFSIRLENRNQLKALRVFYESLIPNSQQNFPQVMNELSSDITFVCPTTLLSSVVSTEKDVFFYVLNYRVSSIPLPSWTGVPHTYDMDLIFGNPLDPGSSYTDEDRQVSRMMMTYWTNFAKSSNPNSPRNVPTIWPTFNSKDQTYMVLDSGSNLATRQGPRRHECAFINEILPKIPTMKDGETTPPPSCVWPEGNGSAGVRQDLSGIAAITLLTLMFICS